MAEEYVNKERLIKDIERSFGEISTPFVVRKIRDFPAADVVPRSEVEELIKSVDDMLDLVCTMTGLELTYYGKYAELKKKYTEERENDKGKNTE